MGAKIVNALLASVLSARTGRIAALVLLCGGVEGQGSDEFLIVDSGRPVADAVIELMKRHPVVITYEDPRYTYAGDLKDVTDEIRNPLAPPRTDGRRTFVPVGGPLQIRYEVSSATNRPANLRETLESIVQAKAVLPAGGRFRVEQSGNVFHVVASQVRDATGRWVEHASVLDVPITLETGDLTFLEMVQAILDEATAKSGVNVGMGPFAGLVTGPSRIEADNEPARDVMLRTLQGRSDRLGWLLYYSPSTQGYVFNIVAASADPTVERRGEPRLAPRPGDPTPAGPRVGGR